MKRARRSSVKKSSVQSPVQKAVGIVREVALGSDYPVNPAACELLINRRALCHELAVAYVEYVDDEVDGLTLYQELAVCDIKTAWLFKALSVIVPIPS